MKMFSFVLAALCSFSSVASFADSPAFNCRYAKTRVENMICQDATLGRLDVILNENYAKVRAKAHFNKPEARMLESTQRDWVRHRDTCQTKTCVRMKYYERIQALCEYGQTRFGDLACTNAEEAMMRVNK